MASRICTLVQSGRAAQIRAIAPVTCGAAMLVPSSAAYEPLPLVSRASVAVALANNAIPSKLLRLTTGIVTPDPPKFPENSGEDGTLL
jgi:hypothetical protein